MLRGETKLIEATMVENNGCYRYITAVINSLGRYHYNVMVYNGRNIVPGTIHGRNSRYKTVCS